MKAILVHTPGGPEQLRLDDAPKPEPQAGQALVKLVYSGVNFIDIYFRSGLYKADPPFGIGMEGAGVVEAVGEGVTDLAVGDRVAYAMQRGSYAEYAVVPAWQLVKIPDSVGFDQAAAVMLQGMTAHYLTHSTWPLKPGDTCLVHAAAGGAGLLIVQMAKMLGATVYGTTSTPEKAAKAKAAGTDEMILYTETDFAKEIKRLTNNRGVDVVYDSVGASTFEQSLDSLRPRGLMVSFGNASGPVPPVAPLLLNQKGSLFLTRPTLAHHAATRDELLWRAGDILGWLGSGKLSVHIEKTYPLAEAAQAQIDLASRKTTGKLLLGYFPMSEAAQRRARLAEYLAQHNLDALLVTSLPNVRYLTGFTGSSGIAVVAPDKATLFTDPRYDVQAHREVDCVVNISRRPVKELHAKLAKSRYSRLGFEATALTVGEFNALTAAISSSKTLLPTSGLVEDLRMVKSADELEIIRKAVQLNSDSFSAAIATVREGMTESELAAEIDHQMRLRGAESPAFETIVAFGPNSALPHARPGARKLTSGELLLIDMGAQVGGYTSDMTRMAYFGTPGRKIKTLHKTLLAAQIAGVNAVKHGVKAGVVDAAARNLLRQHQLDERFTHSTGHGLGLEIHETPRLGRAEKTLLQAGMTVTVEPGIYFEDELGMRIEDTVLVTPGGCEVLDANTQGTVGDLTLLHDS